MNLTKISKLLSFILRHNPQEFEIELDDFGYVDVDTLIKKINQKRNLGLTRTDIDFVVANNNKKRFAFNNDGSKIRASQGHSIPVILNYKPVTPPDILYHGTTHKFLQSILQQGLLKMKRHHVHLSVDVETAIKVGQRHGKPVVFKIDAAKMITEGYDFYQSDNGVWLTETVPSVYLELFKE